MIAHSSQQFLQTSSTNALALCRGQVLFMAVMRSAAGTNYNLTACWSDSPQYTLTCTCACTALLHATPALHAPCAGYLLRRLGPPRALHQLQLAHGHGTCTLRDQILPCQCPSLCIPPPLLFPPVLLPPAQNEDHAITETARVPPMQDYWCHSQP